MRYDSRGRTSAIYKPTDCTKGVIIIRKSELKCSQIERPPVHSMKDFITCCSQKEILLMV